MISTLKFAKYLHRYVKIENRMEIGILFSAFNRRTYHHQLHDLGKSRELTVIVGVKNIVTGLQTSSTVRRHLSSAIDGSELIVRHDPIEGKFYVDVAGFGSAFLEYERKDELIILKHTYVPNKLGGRGIGKILAKVALEYVAKHDLQLEIQCSFVRKYVSKYEPKYIKYIEK